MTSRYQEGKTGLIRRTIRARRVWTIRAELLLAMWTPPPVRS